MDRTASPVASPVAVDVVLDSLTDWDAVERRVRTGELDEATRLLGLRHPDPLVRSAAVAGRGLTPAVLSAATWDPRMEVRAVAARHPCTPPVDLLELARDRSKFVRAGVAANPSTPLLARLVVGGTDGAPTGVEPAVDGREPPVMAALLDDEFEGVRLALARRTDLPLAWVRRLAEDACWEVRGVIARTTNRADVLIGLANGGRDHQARWGVARNETAPVAALTAVVDHGEAWERFAVFENPNVPEALALRIAGDPDPEVRRRVVKSPCVTDATLAAYATDPDHLVRLRLAESPRVSAESLIVLAADPDLRCRHAVAAHPSTPPEALALLAAGRSSQVRWAVTRHPAVPRSLLEQLAGDRVETVREAAVERIATLDRLATLERIAALAVAVTAGLEGRFEHRSTTEAA
jgi:hypothetical protein